MYSAVDSRAPCLIRFVPKYKRNNNCNCLTKPTRALFQPRDSHFCLQSFFFSYQSKTYCKFITVHDETPECIQVCKFSDSLTTPRACLARDVVGLTQSSILGSARIIRNSKTQKRPFLLIFLLSCYSNTNSFFTHK